MNSFNEINLDEAININGGSPWAAFGLFTGTSVATAGYVMTVAGIATLNPFLIADGAIALGSGVMLDHDAIKW